MEKVTLENSSQQFERAQKTASTEDSSKKKKNQLMSLALCLKTTILVDDFEGLFKMLFIAVAGIFVFFINGLIEFRFLSEEKQIRTIPWSYNLISLFVVFALYALKNFIKTACWDWTMENLSDKYEGEQREFRAKKILKWIYDTIYYSTTTVFSLWAFRNAPFMPSVFGGKGECSSLLDSYPQFPNDPTTEITLLYHMVQFGSHAFALLELMFLRRQEELKFYEYGLHHFMAAGLIFYSGMLNFLHVSVLVLIIHDMGDIITAGGRAYADMKFKSKYILYTIMGIALLVWIGTRIIIFPSCIIYNCWQFFSRPDQALWDIIKYVYTYLFIQLLILYAMHCYWTLFMLKISFGYLIKPNYQNHYDNKDFKKLSEKKKD